MLSSEGIDDQLDRKGKRTIAGADLVASILLISILVILGAVASPITRSSTNQTLGDYSVSVSPTTLSVQQGGTATVIVTVTSMNGFSGPVRLAWTSSGLEDFNGTFSQDPVTPLANGSTDSVFTLSVSNEIPRVYKVIIVAQLPDASMTRSASFVLVVTER
jgi:hypothetical protein